MATFGNTSLTNTSGIATVTNGLFLTLFTLSADGYVTNLRVNVFASTGNSVYLCGLVYKDTAGYPSIVKGKTLPTKITATGSPLSFDLRFQDALFLAAGDYWLGVTPGQDTYPSISYVDATCSSLIDSANDGAFTGNPPDPMTAALTIFTDQYKILLHAEYIPTALWNVPLKTTQKYLSDKAGIAGLSKQQALNVLMGAGANEGLSKQDAANIYAGTTGLSTQDALRSKAGASSASTEITSQEAARRL